MSSKTRIKRPVFVPKSKRSPKLTAATLPNEILINIFEKLSIRDLCKCGLVCKRWLEASTQDVLWKKKYNSIIKRPHPPTGENWKSAFLQSGLQLRNDCLQKIQERYRKKLGFTKTINFREIRVSLVMQLFSPDGRKCLYTEGYQLREELQHNLTQATFPPNKRAGRGGAAPSMNRTKHPTSDTNPLPPLSEIGSCHVYLVVPVFPERVMPYRQSPRQYQLIYKTPFTPGQFKACSCRAAMTRSHQLGGRGDANRSADSVIDLHTCLQGISVALWAHDQDLAFISFSYLTMDILQALAVVSELGSFSERRSTNSNKSSTSSLASKTLTSDSVFTRFAGSLALDDKSSQLTDCISPAVDLFDLVGDLLLNNFDGDPVLSYVIRSFSCDSASCAQLLRAEDRGSHIPFDGDPIVNWRIGCIGSVIKDVVVLKMVVEDRNKTIVWSISRPVLLTPIDSEKVQYDYEGEYLSFQVSDKRAELQGIVMRQTDSDYLGSAPFKMYLIDLRWRLLAL